MSDLTEKVISYLGKTSGRDKAMRLIQFFFRFVKGFLLKVRERTGNSNQFQAIIKKLDIISSNFSMTRRLLRFGRTLGFQKSFSRLLKSYKAADGKNVFDKYNYFWMYVLPHGFSDLLTIVQFYVDHYLYLHKLGVFSAPNLYKILNIFSDYSWLSDIVICIFCCVFEICLLKRKIKSLKQLENGQLFLVDSKPNTEVENQEKKDKEIQDLNQKISDIKKDIAKLAFDLPVSYYYINDKYSHIIWIGLTGTISSAIGAYQAWS